MNVTAAARSKVGKVRALCLVKALLILLEEDRSEAGADGLLRTTHREMVEVLSGVFGLDVDLMTLSRLFGRLRSRPGAGPEAARGSVLSVLEEVEVGRLTARGYVPSVYKPSALLERLLSLEGAGTEALPEPVLASGTPETTEAPPGAGDATAGQGEPETEEPTVALAETPDPETGEPPDPPILDPGRWPPTCGSGGSCGSDGTLNS